MVQGVDSLGGRCRAMSPETAVHRRLSGVRPSPIVDADKRRRHSGASSPLPLTTAAAAASADDAAGHKTILILIYRSGAVLGQNIWGLDHSPPLPFTPLTFRPLPVPFPSPSPPFSLALFLEVHVGPLKYS